MRCCSHFFTVVLGADSYSVPVFFLPLFTKAALVSEQTSQQSESMTVQKQELQALTLDYNLRAVL